MTELSRSLLAAAREGLAPDAATVARVRAKVAATVGGATAAATAAPTAKAGSSALLLKLGAALLAIGVVTTAIVVARSERAAEVPRIRMTSSESDAVQTEVRVASNDEYVPGEEPVAAPAPTKREPQRAQPAASSSVPVPAAIEPASLSREVELIDLAMVSLRRNAPLVALEAIRVFERETQGQGQMAEDAAAIEIEARCKLGEEVTAAIARFDHKWPRSAQRDRLQSACFASK